MHKYFRNKDIKADTGTKDKIYFKLAFEKVIEDIPELTDRVFLLRSRIKELKRNFELDALRMRRWFIAVTIITVVSILLILIAGLWYAARHQDSQTISSIVVLTGAFSALAAAATNSFGLHKRYSAMFSAYWAMKALETSMDLIVFDIARDIEDPKRLSKVELARLRVYLDSWLLTFSSVLMSFGDNYGSALAAVAMTPIKQSGK